MNGLIEVAKFVAYQAWFGLGLLSINRQKGDLRKGAVNTLAAACTKNTKISDLDAKLNKLLFCSMK